MNWLIKLGQWWESKKEHSVSKRLERLEQEKPVSESIKMAFSAIDKDLKIINSRLDHIELYTGLKREPKAAHIPGGAKIA